MVLQEGGARVCLGRRGHDHIDQHQQDRAHDCGTPWPVGAVLGFLVDADAAVPAPVDEHPEEDAVDQSGGAAVEGEGVEPVGLDVEAARIAEVNLGERDRREQAQCRDLGGEQEVLGASRELDADVADRGHHDDPDCGDDADVEKVGRSRVESEEQERVDPGDVGESRHDDDIGDDDRPAGEPAEPRPHRPGHPGEAGAAVRVGPVHVVVGGGDQQHRDEGDDHHGRRVEPHPVDRDHEPERCREAVSRRGRRHADHQVGHPAEGACLQALLTRPRPLRVACRNRDRRALQILSFPQSSRDPCRGPAWPRRPGLAAAEARA